LMPTGGPFWLPTTPQRMQIQLQLSSPFSNPLLTTSKVIR